MALATPTAARHATLVVLGLAIAGTIHLGAASLHGVHTEVFAALGVSQVVVAGALVRHRSGLMLRSALLLGAVPALAWVASRAGVGIAGHPVGLLDVLATVAELIAVASAAVVIRREPNGHGAGRPGLLMLGAAALVAFAVVLVVPGGGHRHDQSEPQRPAVAPAAPPRPFGDLFDHHSFEEPHDGHSH